MGSVPWYYRHHTSLAWKETKTQNLSVVSGWGYRLVEEACPGLLQYSKFNTQHCSSEGKGQRIQQKTREGRVRERSCREEGRKEGGEGQRENVKSPCHSCCLTLSLCLMLTDQVIGSQLLLLQHHAPYHGWSETQPLEL